MPERGDRVVVEPVAAEFYEARVLEVMGDRARVQALESGDPSTVALGDVYAARSSRPLSANDFGICKLGQGWVACRVVAVEAEALRVLSFDGKTSRIAAAMVLAPTPVTELNIKRRFERAREKSEFRAALLAAGAPRAPRSFKPMPGEQVLVRLDDGWFSGTIHELGKEEHAVRLSGAGRIAQVSVSDVIPMSSGPLAAKRGDFVLARPLSAAAPWAPVRVNGVADDQVAVSNAEGNRRSLSTSEVVPFAR